MGKYEGEDQTKFRGPREATELYIWDMCEEPLRSLVRTALVSQCTLHPGFDFTHARPKSSGLQVRRSAYLVKENELKSCAAAHLEAA